MRAQSRLAATHRHLHPMHTLFSAAPADLRGPCPFGPSKEVRHNRDWLHRSRLASRIVLFPAATKGTISPFTVAYHILESVGQSTDYIVAQLRKLILLCSALSASLLAIIRSPPAAAIRHGTYCRSDSKRVELCFVDVSVRRMEHMHTGWTCPERKRCSLQWTYCSPVGGHCHSRQPCRVRFNPPPCYSSVGSP